MSERQTDEIRDPKALRALAHPLRWKLLQLIGDEEVATATRCAEVLGESVASCSYHLNMLAKYDYVEHAPGGQGREKPWRLVKRRQILGMSGMDGEVALAAEAATEAFVDNEFAQLKARLRRESLESEEWQRAIGLIGVTTFLTAEEVVDVRDQLDQLARRYADRVEDPSVRPPGARSVRLFLATTVAPQKRPAD
ncbi:helix-turn-helix transcriptional regulator [Solihabitans fulvus]|uniref:Helix-turn-helix transcriptional regulator n=1 Tax=Solihabitans fulvus TaxID=1892852 RepID=A0A5B2XS08_9PSEU|nr:helix-turn-helix domain-containing protein [Solihabitans fulvus]KAA2266163.1 helix-turn-helix transcriptional regulator [Solihabitans fulvus]